MRKPKVTTKTGDDGYTGLLGPGRVPKHHPRVRAFGTIDEATSALGLARALVEQPLLKEMILEVQRDLYVLMAELATPAEAYDRIALKITETHVKKVEDFEARLHAGAEIPNVFVIPGETVASATLDLARTIARRAEREVVQLFHDHIVGNVQIVRYLNRLSDLVFIMARYEEVLAGKHPRRTKDEGRTNDDGRTTTEDG